MAQILRIVFRSGRVAERRGDDLTVARMFEIDEQGLIDYVMSIDLETRAVAFFTEDDDPRFCETQVLTMPSIGGRGSNQNKLRGF